MSSDDQAKQPSQNATVRKPSNRNSVRKMLAGHNERPRRIPVCPVPMGKIRIWMDSTGDRSRRSFSSEPAEVPVG
jgi:hypothetical protein